MKRRFLRWISRFLEVYARESLTEEIERLNSQNQALLNRIAERDSYIAGIRRAMRDMGRAIRRKEVK